MPMPNLRKCGVIGEINLAFEIIQTTLFWRPCSLLR